MHLKSALVNSDHFRAESGEQLSLFVTVHRYLDPTCVRELFSADLHVASSDHDVICVERPQMIDLTWWEDQTAFNDDG